MNAAESEPESVTHDCPFPDCDWEHEYTHLENGQPIDDYPTASHYEKEHGGRVRVQVTVEYDQILGGRSTKQVRESALERFEDNGHDVAHVRTEVLREADDHSRLDTKSEGSE